MSEFTPGPWMAQGGIIYPADTTALEPDRPVPDRIRASGEMFEIARVFAPERWRDGSAADVHEANAHLIAAAPDMHRALSVMALHHSSSPYIGEARAALAKAEGGDNDHA